jgi:hypothetical protein
MSLFDTWDMGEIAHPDYREGGWSPAATPLGRRGPRITAELLAATEAAPISTLAAVANPSPHGVATVGPRIGKVGRSQSCR